MTKTTNYQLPQWEAADPIQRADFNAAMATLDAGVRTAQETADGAQTAAGAAQNTAQAAYTAAQNAQSTADAAVAAASAVRFRTGTFLAAEEEAGTTMLTFASGAKAAILWDRDATPAVFVPGVITRLYFASWNLSRDFAMTDDKITVGSKTDTTSRLIRYIIFY